MFQNVYFLNGYEIKIWTRWKKFVRAATEGQLTVGKLYNGKSSISLQIEWDMIVVTVFLSIFWKLKGELSPRSYPIRFERKWKYSFISAQRIRCAVVRGYGVSRTKLKASWYPSNTAAIYCTEGCKGPLSCAPPAAKKRQVPAHSWPDPILRWRSTERGYLSCSRLLVKLLTLIIVNRH